jgi:hypothetical protein
MNRSAQSQLLLLAVVSTIGQLGCKSDSAAVTGNSSIVPDLSKLNVTAVTQTSVEGIVGAVAGFSPTVRVTNTETLRPVANVEVRFTGSTVGLEIVTTDKDGLASAGAWRFSTRAGRDTLSVSLGEQVRVRFLATLTPDVPAEIRTGDQGELVALAGAKVGGFGVLVVDKFGNWVPGVPLSFSVSAGVLDSSHATTAWNGGAYTGRWVLDKTPGVSRLTIIAEGMAPKVVFGVGIDSAAVRWYKLKEYRSGTDVTSADSEIRQARFGVTGMENCPCATLRGFFIDDWTLASTSPDMVQYGGRFELAGTDLKLPESNPLAEGAYMGARVHGDELLIDRLHFIYLSNPYFPDKVVVVTWVYTRVVD